MLFTSGSYFVFLILVFFAYWLIAERYQWRIIFLAAVSYFFYSQSGPLPTLLLFSITTTDFIIAGSIHRGRQQRARKLLLCLSLFIDIGALCVFKYANFFLDSANVGLNRLGLRMPIEHLNIIVPMGISFFIFQSVAYVVDVYRKDSEPAQNYFEYLSFISFFPTLIAGPILRAKQLLPQLRGNIKLDPQIGAQALFLIMLGLIKKIAIADYLSANFVDRVFDFPERFSALEVLAAIYGYALQIYADFSGYSEIAIGSAMLLGFNLPVNFNMPYRSRDLPEFWRRWHITLSNWLRDYLFFSLVGPRSRNMLMLYCGLVVTMLIGGLWHGPTWTFVIWGLLHGVGLAIARGFDALRKRWTFLPRNGIWSNFISVIITFHFVCFAWIFFRAETLAQAIGVLKQLTTVTVDRSNLATPIAIMIVIGLASHWLPDRIWERARTGFVQLPAIAQAFLLCIAAIGLYFVASSDVVPFIYAKF